MTVSLFSNLFVNGLAMGMVYAMLAIGLILLIRAVGILNFAQGDLLMFGAYLTSSLILDVQVPGWLMVPIAMICFMVVGLVFMFGVYWPLRKASYPAATIIATMGASIILKESVTLIWGSVPRSLPAIITDAESRPGILHLGDVSIQWQYILIVVIGVVIIAAIHLLFEKLYVGKMMQAACQDAYAANLMGVPSILTIAATYMIVTVVAGFGGYMVAPIYMVRNTLGTLQLRAFAGVVIVAGPTFHSDFLPLSMAFFSSITSGIAYTLLRYSKGKTDGMTVIMHFSSFSAVCSIPFTLGNFVVPNAKELMALVLIGLFGSLGQIALTYAYRLAPAGEVSIYNYSGILFSMVLGFLCLGETIPATSFMGGALVIAASLLVYVDSRRQEKKQA